TPLTPTTDRDEQSTVVPQGENPSQFRQPAFKTPIVFSTREQLIPLLIEHRACVCADVIDSILGEPALHLGQGVTVLLRMLILISHPRSSPCRLILSIA